MYKNIINKDNYFNSFRRSRGGVNYLFLIAINEYENFPILNNCVDDTKSFKKILTSKYQFEQKYIFELFDAKATRFNILQKLNDYKSEMKPADNLIIYFSGHGQKEGNIGFWIPVDAQSNIDASFISISDIKNRLDYVKSLHTLVIVDACFAGTLFLKHKSYGGGKSEHFCSRWGLAACHSREVALDGEPGENSPFAKQLLRYLKESIDDITAVDLATKVINGVRGINNTQEPQFRPLNVKGDDGGMFLFRRRLDKNSEWIKTCKIDSIITYRTFYAKADEKYKKKALKRLGILLEKDERRWSEAKVINSIESYQKYLENNSEGLHRKDANIRINSLENRNNPREQEFVEVNIQSRSFNSRRFVFEAFLLSAIWIIAFSLTEWIHSHINSPKLGLGSFIAGAMMVLILKIRYKNFSWVEAFLISISLGVVGYIFDKIGVHDFKSITSYGIVGGAVIGLIIKSDYLGGQKKEILFMALGWGGGALSAYGGCVCISELLNVGEIVQSGVFGFIMGLIGGGFMFGKINSYRPYS